MTERENQLAESIIALETRIAFQDRTIEELNLVVTNLRNQMDILNKKVASLSVQAIGSFVAKDDSRPPHY